MTTTARSEVWIPAEVAWLGPYVAAGVLDRAEVHLVATFARLDPDAERDALLALAVAARGVRQGHVAVALDQVRRIVVDRPDVNPDLPAVDPGRERSGRGHSARDQPAREQSARELGAAAGQVLRWPDPPEWAATLAASGLVASPETALEEPVRPLVWDGRRLYLQRYWCAEQLVAQHLRSRTMADDATSGLASARAAEAPGASAGEGQRLAEVVQTLFGGPDPTGPPDGQAEAARMALSGGLAVIVGGPGTGKTRTVARIITAAMMLADGRSSVDGDHDRGRDRDRAGGRAGSRSDGVEFPSVALAAPTGKAAARMTDALRAAVSDLRADGAVDEHVLAEVESHEAVTLHRLLGVAPGRPPRRDRYSSLPHDIVVVDETSMVDLPMMALLLDAIRPDASVVLVGDPHQLASVEAGVVLGDMVAPVISARDGDVGPTRGPEGFGRHVAVLRRSHRFGAESGIAKLATAVRTGDVAGTLALLQSDAADLQWVPDEGEPLAALRSLVVDGALEVVDAAAAGEADAALSAAAQLKVLAAVRHRSLGLYEWSDLVEAEVRRHRPGLDTTRRWYVGRPVMIIANDPITGVANGDVGVVVGHGDGTALAMQAGDDIRFVPTARLDAVETWWAMTIHKSQGSEFTHAVVSLPPPDSPVLTRELLYTGVTRARQRLTVVGSVESITAAVERPAERGSGLGALLWGQDATQR